MKIVKRLAAIVRKDEGQDLIEYAFLVGLISLVCVAAITAAGGSVAGIWGAVSGALANVPGA
jgi:Flp pilus assembly pilin Flp